MNRMILGSALLLCAAAPALAQPTPGQMEARPSAGSVARGAEIRIERPDMSLFVRCGEGESAKSCSETATQLMEKLVAMPLAERRERGGEREERRRRDRDRDRDRE